MSRRLQRIVSWRLIKDDRKRTSFRFYTYLVFVPLASYLAFILFKESFSDVIIGRVCWSKTACAPAVIYQGEINRSGLAKLEKALSKELKLLCFDSTGGNHQQTLGVAKLIVDKQLSTCVGEVYFDGNNKRVKKVQIGYTTCESNCIPLFSLGINRTQYGNAVFKPHRIGNGLICRISKKFYQYGLTNSLKTSWAEFSDEEALAMYLDIARIKYSDNKIPDSIINLANETTYGKKHCLTDVEYLNAGFETTYLKDLKIIEEVVVLNNI